MSSLSRRALLASAFATPAVAPRAAAQFSKEWIPLFDGSTLNGWKTGGSAGSFKVVDGSIAADGPRAHLYYDGPVRDAEFRNFELVLDVKSRPQANSGVFFHTRYQPEGFPEQGFEIQINNTATGEGRYRERKKTGSLYGVRNVYKAFARDDECFPMQITVRSKRVQVHLNGMLLVDYVEPDPPLQASKTPGRVLQTGTFALQCHDPGSKAFFRNIKVRLLPDDVPASADAFLADDTSRDLLELSAHNFPLVDYHVHLKSGWSIGEALQESRRTGIQYGIAINCGKGFPVTDDAGARSFLDAVRRQPIFTAMQAEGREWVRMFSRDTVASFDYVFTDAMTFTDENGKRMRTWIPDEVGQIADRQKFMDTLVSRILGIMNTEPVDIYANPTYLPDLISEAYDELWTLERMEKVIEAARKNDIAIELNNRYKLPGIAFVKLAKSAGLKFAFGTNNTDRNIGRCEYAIRMVKECGLGWQDIFVPKPEGEKPVQLRGLPS
jgi:hypothetical protein